MKFGLDAYWTYNMILNETFCCGCDRFTMREVCGAFAALSPNSSESNNFADLAVVIAHHIQTHYKELSEPLGVSAYKDGVRKALRILRGGNPEDVLTGRKTRSFYFNLVDPGNHEHVTIDGHAYNVWIGERHLLKSRVISRGLGSPPKYRRVADDYREAARQVGLIPNQVQAITWFAWKRMHRILWPVQLKMILLP